MIVGDASRLQMDLRAGPGSEMLAQNIEGQAANIADRRDV